MICVTIELLDLLRLLHGQTFTIVLSIDSIPRFRLNLASNIELGNFIDLSIKLITRSLFGVIANVLIILLIRRVRIESGQYFILSLLSSLLGSHLRVLALLC